MHTQRDTKDHGEIHGDKLPEHCSEHSRELQASARKPTRMDIALTRALQQVVQPRGGPTALAPAETAALLSSAWSSSVDGDPGVPGCVALCCVRLLRAEAARLERDHAAVVGLGCGGGVRLALAALGLPRLPPPASDGSDDPAPDRGSSASEHELRIAAEAAAALADLVGGAGANKAATLEGGGVDLLLR